VWCRHFRDELNVLLSKGLRKGDSEHSASKGQRDPAEGRDPGDDLLADGYPGGAPVCEVLAIVAGQAVAAFTDAG
jgi:hypothetical protein